MSLFVDHKTGQFFLKNNETDKIKISNFDPYNIFLSFATNIPMYDWFVVQGHICVRECVYVYVCMYIYIYMKSSFPKRDKRPQKKKMSSSCHFAVYWTYSLLHQCFMPNRYISLFKMYCKMQFFSKPL